MDILKALRASIQRFKWSKEEEKGFQSFHGTVNLTIIRISILLLAILCLPVVILQERNYIQILVIIIVCLPCVSLFIMTFTPFFQHRLIMGLLLFISAETLLTSCVWLTQTDSAIIFFFVLHIVHLSGLLRFSHGAILSCIIHLAKITNDYVYFSTSTNIFKDIRALSTETIIELLCHFCFLYISYRNESHLRQFFELRNELNTETREAERLLLNSLPQQAIERLQNDEFPISDKFENSAAVLIEVTFSDKVASTETSVVLSEIFFILDELATQYGLERVNGFRGDEYLVLSTQEKSCYLSATFSISAQQQIAEYLQAWDESQSFNQQATFRIAIATSTIFAGIVGSEKLTYDFWGDALGVVQEMMASGVSPENSIVVTCAVYNNLSKGQFAFQPTSPITCTLRPHPLCLFTLHDPSQPITPSLERNKPRRINMLQDLFSLEWNKSQQHPPLEEKEIEARFELNPITLSFDKQMEERIFVSETIREQIWQIRVSAALWLIICALETVKVSEDMVRLGILAPVVFLFEVSTFFIFFFNNSQICMLILSLLVAIHYLYFAYFLDLALSFFIYPLFIFYLLPLKFIHAAILAALAFISYMIMLCINRMTDTSDTIVQVVALSLVIIQYQVAAYQIQKHVRQLHIYTDALKNEKQKTEERLRVIIPIRLIPNIRNGQFPIIYNFPDVGLACVTITNMHSLSKDHSFNQMASILNKFHTDASRVTPPYIDKIKTIGPMSLVAGGMPVGAHEARQHIIPTLAKWALSLLSIISSDSLSRRDGCSPDICIVIHYGDVFAGVIGTKKYHFDLWGANMLKLQKSLEAAKQIENNVIYVTEEAYELLSSLFVFRPKAVNTPAGPLYQLLSEINPSF